MIEQIVNILWESDLTIIALSAIVFDLPRYTFSIMAVVIFDLISFEKRSQQPSLTVTIIVPCYNGEKSLSAAIHALEKCRDENVCEIIVVNDGSTDKSLEIAQELKDSSLINRVINHAVRCGKSASINHAARFAISDLILVIDSDTQLEKNAITEMITCFSDEKVAGVSGNILVRNSNTSFISSLQSIEYLISITTGKTFVDYVGCMSCISGACSMFRRSVFLDLGGMDVGPGEDLEITLRLRRAGYKVKFAPNALSYTNVPETFSALIRQRFRWDRDAFRIRMLMYRESRLFFPDEKIGDTLQRLDYILFDLMPTISFPLYLVYVFNYYEFNTLYYLVGIYISLLTITFMNLAFIILFIPHRLSSFDTISALALPLFQGLILKVSRFYSYTCELLWNGSRKDNFVPEDVRRALYGTNVKLNSR